MSVHIPVYEALAFEREMTGGRNRPWLLLVQTDQGIESYVTKFFVQRDIDQQNALCKEIYANIIARELGLPTPDFALITVDDRFKETLTQEQRNELDRRHIRYGFGSKFIAGNFTFSPAQHTRELADYDIESIFAFDVLVLNVDRRKGKPNILLDDSQYYLIDHEHTLSLTSGGVSPKKRIAIYPFQNHIFHEVLSRKATYGNTPDFGTFREHFRALNCNALDPYASHLENIGYETDDSLVIKRYLEELKRDIPWFLTMVEGGIQ